MSAIIKWKKPLITTFIYATLLLGLTDFFHTATGVQRYLFDSEIFLIHKFRWPWYVPVQMGAIAVMAMTMWVIVYNALIHQRLRTNHIKDVQPFGAFLPLFVALMVIIGFFLGYITIDYDYHMSVYLFAYIISLLFLSFSFSIDYLLAFLLVGMAGPLFEWLLLSPTVGYYEFVQKDIFGRVPTWQLFAYGWGGVFFHWISCDIRK